jgi:hypothetical protein
MEVVGIPLLQDRSFVYIIKIQKKFPFQQEQDINLSDGIKPQLENYPMR